MQPRSKKYGLSCLVCRRRKVRCDGRRPNCANCVRLDERCVYSIQDSSITRLQNALTKSEQRLKTLEQRLRSLLTLEPKRCQDTLRDILASSEDAHPHTPQIPSNNANHSDTTRSDEDAAAQYAYETHEEDYEETSRFHVEEERSKYTTKQDDKQHVEYHKKWLRSNARFCKTYEQLAFSSLATNALIDAQTATVLLNIYWTWQAPLHCCVYRRNFFRDMVMKGPYFSQFLLNVIYAHAARHIPPSDIRYTMLQGGEPFLEQAKLLLLEELKRDQPAIPTIQGLLILGGRQCALGRNSEGWLYTGMAIRMVKDIGLHLPHRSRLDAIEPDDFECQKRLYLSAYAWDKSISLCLGRPPSLTSMPYTDDCLFDTSDNADVWTPYYLGELEMAYLPTPACSSKTFSALVKLSVIVNQAYKLAFGPRARHVTLTQLQALENELYTFYQNLPVDLRMTEDVATTSCPPPHICCLNILYHTILILLYRPFFLRKTSNEPLCRHAEMVCTREAATVNVFFQAYGRCFANRNQTYLLSYCVYTAATIEVEQASNENAVTARAAIERLATTLAMLEHEAKQTPGIRRSVDIINGRLTRLPQQMREMIPSPVQNPIELPAVSSTPADEQIGRRSSAIGTFQYSTTNTSASANNVEVSGQGPQPSLVDTSQWLEADLSFQYGDVFTPDVGGGFVPDILSWYNSFD